MITLRLLTVAEKDEMDAAITERLLVKPELRHRYEPPEFVDENLYAALIWHFRTRVTDRDSSLIRLLVILAVITMISLYRFVSSLLS